MACILAHASIVNGLAAKASCAASRVPAALVNPYRLLILDAHVSSLSTKDKYCTCGSYEAISTTVDKSLASTGVPAAAASSTAPGKPSHNDGKIKRSAAFNRRGTSERSPTNRT